MHERNLQMLRDTLSTLKTGYYPTASRLVYLKLSAPERKHASVLLPEQIPSLQSSSNFDHTPCPSPCEVTCENMDSFSMARKRLENVQKSHAPYPRILVLNFANSVHPGGGVRRGASAQEEDLCRKSSLLLSLESDYSRPYYEYHRSLNTNMASDAMIFSPRVEILKDADGSYLPDTCVVSVLTCAAPNRMFGTEGMSEAAYEDMFYRRILSILTFAAFFGHRRLVLGAFGCGAFGNDARLISDLFCRALHEFRLDGMTAREMFASIDFAVLSRSPDQYNYHEFARNFGSFHWFGPAPAADGLQPVLFWKTTDRFGCLSNWYPSPFVIDDFIYDNAEQYIMARKAKLNHDAYSYTKILRTSSPKECKALGRAVQPFDPVRWEEARSEVLRTALMAKFTQNPDLRKILLDTGSAVIAEASPLDRVFGIGLTEKDALRTDPAQWPGQNLLGNVLMDVRDRLRQNGR